MATTLVQADLPLPLYARGKVRDVYTSGEYLLIVATDRISAFDHVLPTQIPEKGTVLTQLSAFWFEKTRPLVANHMVSADWEFIVRRLPVLQQARREAYAGRTMLVRHCHRIDIECVVRGYLTGSAWEEYRLAGTVAGRPMLAGMRNGDRFAQPVFTPATKSAQGHDENISFDRMTDMIGAPMAIALRDASLALYRFAADHARRSGLLLADTKFEFGVRNGQLTLIDEALTPDSSRYWDAAQYPSSLVQFDKQFVRDYLNQVGWNHEPPVPELPADVVAATQQRYQETLTRLTR
ncbi:MAG TPA: phosphoribosylaminoimidazolesuccinocarboxamide synthase [bacterium]|jgi:phosphoribosylaminoimidazole-succinocarboxamide synthase